MRGRRGTVTKEVLENLRKAFKIGASIREACLFAGISLKTWDRYIAKHPEFRGEMKCLQSNPTFQAKVVLMEALKDKDKAVASFVLRREDQKAVRREYGRRWRAEQKSTEGEETFKTPSAFIQSLMDELGGTQGAQEVQDEKSSDEKTA